MSSFQTKLKGLIDSPTFLEDDEELLKYLEKKYNDGRDYSFLFDEIKRDYNLNPPYFRNIAVLVGKLKGKIANIDEIKSFLLDVLKNHVAETTQYSRDISIKLICYEIGEQSDLVVLQEIYDFYDSKNYFSISSIEFITDYFSKFEKSDYFIKSFLKKSGNWFRLTFQELEKGKKNNQQMLISSFNRIKTIKFLKELGKEKNIFEFINHSNSFTEELIEKWKKQEIDLELYDFFINIFLYAHGNYYSYRDSIYNENTLNLLMYFKSKKSPFYENFFRAIKYGEEGYYYFRDFEIFLSKTIQTKSDVKEISSSKILIKDDSYILYRIYSWCLSSGSNNDLIDAFKSHIGKEIKAIEEKQKEYQIENEKLSKLDEGTANLISSRVKLINIEGKKNFVGELLSDYINLDSDYFRDYKIEEIITEQINRFFTFENLDPNTKESLNSFKKTKEGYRGYTYLHDMSLEIVLKASKKVGFDFKKYNFRISGFFPFQFDTETLLIIKDILDAKSIESIIATYNEYEVIREFRPENLIELFNPNSYEKDSRVISVKEISEESLNTLKGLFEKFLDYESLGTHYKSVILDLFDTEELKKDSNFFIDIFNKTSGKLNYFKDYLVDEIKYSSFLLALKSNKILLQRGDTNATIWRIEQLINGFSKVLEVGSDTQEISHIQAEVSFRDSNDFLSTFSSITSNKVEIENAFLKLINESFRKYKEDSSYYEFCFYAWRGLSYFLKSNNTSEYFVGKVAKLIKEQIEKDVVIYFKRYVQYNKNFYNTLRIQEKELKIEELEDIIQELPYKKKEKDIQILILTEGPSDYYHILKAWRELMKKSLINGFSKNLDRYLKQVKNNELVKVNRSCTETYLFLKQYSTLNNQSLVIGIFDSDDTKFLKDDYDSSMIESMKKGIPLQNKELNNLYILLIHKRKKETTIEKLYSERFLKGKVISNERIDKLKKVELFGKPLFIDGKSYIDGIKKNGKLIYDTGDFNVYKKGGVVDTSHAYKTKMSLAQEIERGKTYDSVIKANTWKNFLHIFKGINKIYTDFLKSSIK